VIVDWRRKMVKGSLTIKYDITKENQFSYSSKIKSFVPPIELLFNALKDIYKHESYSYEKMQSELEEILIDGKKLADEHYLTFLAHRATENTICYMIKHGKSDLEIPTKYKCPTCSKTLYDTRKDGLFYYCPNCEIAHNQKYLK